LVKGSYRLGVNQHFRDRYSGKLRGNYSTLEKDSETQEQFHQFGITINTVDAYLSNKFALPMIASLTAHESLGGRNTVRSRYIELSIATFFKGHTPRAELADESPRVEPQMTKTVSQTDAIPAITEDGE
jgi:hypothetical protein